MHVEYWRNPVGSTRLPCGMVQVSVRATSVCVGVYTTETDEGTISPCRLKLTMNAYKPSGVTSIDAGKYPRKIPGPTSVSGPSSYRQYFPSGEPCPVVMCRYFPSREIWSPCGPSSSDGDSPTENVFSTTAPSGPKRMRWTRSADSAPTY